MTRAWQVLLRQYQCMALPLQYDVLPVLYDAPSVPVRSSTSAVQMTSLIRAPDSLDSRLSFRRYFIDPPDSSHDRMRHAAAGVMTSLQLGSQ